MCRPLSESLDTGAESADLLEQRPPWGSREALRKKDKDTLKHTRDTGYYNLSSALRTSEGGSSASDRERGKVRELVELPRTLVLLLITASHGGAPRFGFYSGGALRVTSMDRRLNKAMKARTSTGSLFLRRDMTLLAPKQ
jgi:hypothetical protein